MSFGVILFSSFLTLARGTSYSLTCAEVKAAGAGTQFSSEDLRSMSNDDFLNCLVILGKDQLPPEQSSYMWQNLKKIYDGADGIPDSDLQQLGWISQGIPDGDIANITLSDVNTIASFGQYHNLTYSQLKALAKQVTVDWASKEPEDYTFYDLMALNHILCGFNNTALRVIHPQSYKEASSVLSKLRGCPKDSLQALISLAVSPDAFGEPSTWSSSQLKSVGCLLNGLQRDVVTKIPTSGFDSLTPDIIPCLDVETLRSMTVSQLSHFTASAAGAVTSEQRSSLGSEQQKALLEAYEGKKLNGVSQMQGSSSYFRPSKWMYTLFVVLTIPNVQFFSAV